MFLPACFAIKENINFSIIILVIFQKCWSTPLVFWAQITGSYSHQIKQGSCRNQAKSRFSGYHQIIICLASSHFPRVIRSKEFMSKSSYQVILAKLLYGLFSSLNSFQIEQEELKQKLSSIRHYFFLILKANQKGVQLERSLSQNFQQRSCSII